MMMMMEQRLLLKREMSTIIIMILQHKYSHIITVFIKENMVNDKTHYVGQHKQKNIYP